MISAEHQRAYRQRLNDVEAKRRAPLASTADPQLSTFAAADVCMEVENTKHTQKVEKDEYTLSD